METSNERMRPMLPAHENAKSGMAKPSSSMDTNDLSKGDLISFLSSILTLISHQNGIISSLHNSTNHSFYILVALMFGIIFVVMFRSALYKA